MALTLEKLQKILIRTPDVNEWYNILSRILPDFGINTDLRIAAFLAQAMHESADFNALSENLNYSDEALVAIFPKYFPSLDDAHPYHRHTVDIANKIYGNRMGNDQPGDGFKFRGRGIFQITGKQNYTACSQYLYKDCSLLDTPEFLTSKAGAVKSACWFWQVNNLNSFADKSDMLTITKRINGGTNGLVERLAKYKTVLSIISK